ncbi:MAG: AarF/UbiB family protein, partial [Actinomycetota bacterium]|nr:AarF/UbiB family protein [Actinomycetota bacterium]
MRKALRLLRISRLLLRHYRAFRTFTKLTDAAQQQRVQIPRQFAQALLDLGPLFVKLGQILSTRPDVLPAAYITELARLQEQVPPFPFAQVRRLIKEQFGTEIEDLFRTFAKRPVAAASLAQVHLAVLPDGTPVAVKVQRPFAQERIRADLDLLAALLAVVRRLFPAQARRLNLVAGFTEFQRYTLQELDFAREATTLERFQHNFAGWPDIIIPHVYRDFVTPKVLTMARVSGLRLKDLAPTLSVLERQRLSHRLLAMEMKMFIADGVFHADLHPGNIFFTAEGHIVLLDFGMYGELSAAHRDHFILYWYAGLQRQTRRAFYHLLQQTTRLKQADEAAYYIEFKELAERFYNSTIAERSLTQTYLAIILRGAQFGFVFPSDLLLQAKALTTA